MIHPPPDGKMRKIDININMLKDTARAALYASVLYLKEYACVIALAGISIIHHCDALSAI